MNKILILGIGPIAIESTHKFHGGGNRAWHFTQALLSAGFEVILVCMRITDTEQNDQPAETCTYRDRLIYYSVDELRCFAKDEYLREKIAVHQPDAIIGACDYPAARASTVAGDLPVWADIHGYPMGEAQAKAHHYRENGFVHHFWNIHRISLLRADRFSVTSERQRMALIGELGTMGRLNQHTFGEELTVTIPISWDINTPFYQRKRNKEDPFVVFFSGGYNLWCDVDTLFQGLEKAMQQDNRIRFLSTGGAIEGHDEKTYPRFQTLIQASPFRDRFELRGWVSKEELEQCMNQAHLGINADLACYETHIGARNRLTEFMARGIPILTTLGTEISQILFFKGLAMTVPMQCPDTLANEIILAADHPQKVDNIARNARSYFEEQYTYLVTSKEMIQWCEHPVHSGDFEYPLQLDYRNPFLSPEHTGGLRKKLQRLFKP